MAHFTFVIPGNRGDLLRSSVNDEYKVKNVTLKNDIPSELNACRQSLNDEGAEFIIDSFDTYYSVLHHGDVLKMDLIYKAYEDLHKATTKLNKALAFLLEDKDGLNEEITAKYVNVLKMLIYVYTQTVLLVEKRNAAKREQQIAIPKGVRKKAAKDAEEEFEVDKKSVLLALNNIIQREISLFWDGQSIEESFINLISGICYEFLQNPLIKKEKEEFLEVFNILGYLIKSYNHGSTFIIRITQLIKLHEHLVQCIPKGIQQLVVNFNYKGILHELIEELTEWQTNENHQDSQGSKHCATVLSSLAALMPDLMMPEVISLNQYLHLEPATLRVSVIAVMVEVILSNLTSHELDEEQRKFRDELLDIILEHTEDNNVIVRSKVFQQWSRLQKENAIPLKFQLQVLEKAVDHLCDKGSLARKMAANCVTTFLSCNAFSSNLSLSSMREELDKHAKLLVVAKQDFKDTKVDELMQLQATWDEMIDPLTKEVEKELDKGKENEDDQHTCLPLDEIPGAVKAYLRGHQFPEAITVLKQAVKNHKFIEKFKKENARHDVEFYMTIFYAIYFDITKIVNQLETNQFAHFSKEDYLKMDSLSKQVDFLKQCVEFLTAIDEAIDLMIDLLETTSTADMNEAIQFFITAYQFNIDRSAEGILAMLRLMQRKEQERKDAVVVAFKRIYLVTDSGTISDHVQIIVERLLRLIKTLPVINLDDLQEIVSDWITKGSLDNASIDYLWKIVTKRVDTVPEDEIAAVVLLRMASVGRKTIISKNINLMTSIAFSDRGRENLQFLGACCEFLSVAYQKVDINSEDPAFKIKSTEQCFTDLVTILSQLFFKPVEFYHCGLFGAIDFAYKLSSKPEHFAEQLLISIVPKIAKKQAENPESQIPHYALIRLCQMCGYIALKQLEYMDDTVYKELKRRQNLRDERKKVKNTTNKKKDKKNKRRSMTAIAASEASTMSVTAHEETVLEGAQAEDTDADFILNILEKDVVTGSGYLAQMAPLIVKICERPDLFETVELQFAGVTALSRYMLVSSEFCKKHIRLLFTIFERSLFPEIKANILVHVSDLLTRFPNIIEPWVDRLFLCLKDPVLDIRQTSFFFLSNLILRDMIRAHSHIPKMAASLLDPEVVISSACKNFFLKLSHKENNLYNALPDIFAHFIEEKVGDDDGLKNSMKVLFDMVENPKHLENIVARFCSKFHLTEDLRQHRLITFCLTLIKYNDKALRRLIEEFPVYKHLVHDDDIYSNFKTIIQSCGKQVAGKADLKLQATELETLINSVFEINENASGPPPPMPKSVRKKPPQRRGRKKGSSKKKKSSSESENSD